MAKTARSQCGHARINKQIKKKENLKIKKKIKFEKRKLKKKKNQHVHSTLCRFFLKEKEIRNCTQRSGTLGTPAGSDSSSRTQASQRNKQTNKQKQRAELLPAAPPLLAPGPPPSLPTRPAAVFPFV